MVKLGIAPAKIPLRFNAFNPAFLAQGKRHLFKMGAELKLINTARFIEWKGQDHPVKGFARFVREVYANSSLTLVAEGDTFQRVKALAEREGIVRHVHFLGGVPHHELPRLLSSHDLYVQPSVIDPKTFQEEGMPLAVLEAMAVGLPMVVTRTEGMPEIAGEENPFARIVPDGDPAAIYQALKDVSEAGVCSQDNSLNSQRRLAVFSQDQQLRELQLVYSEALQTFDAEPAAIILPENQDKPASKCGVNPDSLSCVQGRTLLAGINFALRPQQSPDEIKIFAEIALANFQHRFRAGSATLPGHARTGRNLNKRADRCDTSVKFRCAPGWPLI